MFDLGNDRLDYRTLATLAAQPRPVLKVSSSARERVDKFRGIVETMLKSGKTYYGINTGFGLLADVKIAPDKLSELQVNLIRSHACGVGEPLDIKSVRALLILRLHTFMKGHGGISWAVCETLLQMLARDIMPVIPCKGSVGASGDLAPLAHLALTLIGEGEVFYEGTRQATATAFAKAGVKAAILGPKEGLSITNGTQFMAARAAVVATQAERLLIAADFIAAMSLDAFRGTSLAFDERIHQLKGQPGQIAVAKILRRIFSEPDAIMASHADCGKVQDPYSFRCIPQVHGASRDAFAYCINIINHELNAVTDNPLIFEDGSILSGGNFHGQSIAMALDMLAIAIAEIGSISEQRTMKLTNPTMSGMPAFLIRDSGLNSGFMIPHVVAAALVSENKILCHPAVVDSIPTSADKEDHVSMGPVAAHKSATITENVSRVLAIELIAACQGVDLHAPHKPGVTLQAIHQAVRVMCPFLDRDKSLSSEIEQVADWIIRGGLEQLIVDAKFDIPRHSPQEA